MSLLAVGCAAQRPVATGAAIDAPDPRALLAQMYQAMGGAAWQPLAGLRLRGRYEQGGLQGTFEQLVDLRAGRDVFSFDLHSTRGSLGISFDHSWWADEKGLPTVDDAPEARIDAATDSFQDRNGYFHPDPSVPVVYAGRRLANGRVYDLVRMRPPQGRELTLWIDAQTHWLTRISALDAEQQPNEVSFSDYRHVAGVWLPFRQRESIGQSGNVVATVTVTHLQLTGPLDDAQFAPPAAEVHDARLLGQVPSTSVPFTLWDGLIIVDVSIDGRAPLPFMLDSGGLNLLTPATASRLGLTLQGNLPVSGVGARLMSSRLAHVRRYQIGQAQLDDQQFIVMPLPGVFAGRRGRPAVAGLLGYELLRRFRVTIDYQQRRLTLTPPSSGSDGERLPLYFDGRQSFIEAAVDGIHGYFRLDTGDDGALTLFDHFFSRHDFPVELPGIGEARGGIGGAIATLLTRVDTLSLGDLTLALPLAELNVAKVGAFATDHIAGNIGSLVWQNFVLTLDYPHRAVFLRKSASFGYTMPYDRSGLRLDLDHSDRMVVTAVDSGSPAALDGIRAGDELLQIGERPVQTDLVWVTTQLTQSAGTPLQLTMRRGSKMFHVNLVLKDLLPLEVPLQRRAPTLLVR
ncbi:MAG TPA: aspartyl protease family protein [Steroidobacteraceae bacterium]|jgi:hypothetical protein|nr:aspartyl protease family protein [Steroidobacteraceae bacterium]